VTVTTAVPASAGESESPVAAGPVNRKERLGLESEPTEPRLAVTVP
jgi:hypothetical protein